MFARIFEYSLKNILRNKFLSISSILVLTLLMFFINILLVIQNISFKLIDSVNEKLTISLYLADDYDKNSVEVSSLINSIKDLGGGIEVFYKNKDDVLEEMRLQDPRLVQIIERTNPLPETIELSAIPIEYWEKLNYIIEGKLFLFSSKDDIGAEEDKQHFAAYSSQYESITKVTKYLVILRITLYIMIAMFLLSIGVIIYSIIGNFVYYYKDEIYITRLVGGSKFFIYGPFSLQGIIYALVSFVIGFIVFYFGVQVTNFLLEEGYSLAFILGDYKLILLLEFMVFIFIGGLSGLISSRKYLK